MPDLPSPSYEYRAMIIRCVDGDTFDATLDLGFSMRRDDRFRVLGIDTPERGHPLHDAAREKLAAFMPAGGIVLVRTVKDRGDKYGRYLASVTTPTVADVAVAMIQSGLARPYDGKGKLPWT